MKNVVIIEKNTSSLKINEEYKNIKDKYTLNGEFTRFNVENRNKRVYKPEGFLPCLDELNERINTMPVYGEFDHPEVYESSLSKSSHIISKATYIKEQSYVHGEIRLLSTYWGREARALVDDGLPIFVSSRAAGITESDGSVSLKKLFTYDIVADPGFATARMHSLNESLGYKTDDNFRIYEMSDESKINELFNMNKNDYVTKQQMTEYSKHLIKEIASTKDQLNTVVKKGSMSPKKLNDLSNYYEDLQETNKKVIKYLDYLSEKVQILVNENKSLKKTSNKLISHNDYLAGNLEKSINYQEYLAENLDKTIGYSEYIAEKLDKNIDYSEYITENLERTINYSNYLAKNLDKNIGYAEYIAENLDKNINYSNYLAENLDKNIGYSEYIAENLDKNITYSNYLAENLDNSIVYSEYIGEHLDDNIAYADYIAENLDKSISYTGLMAEKLNGSKKLFESKKSKKFIPTLEDMGFEDIQSDDIYDREIDRDEDEILDDENDILDNEDDILSNEDDMLHNDDNDLDSLSDNQEIINGEITGDIIEGDDEFYGDDDDFEDEDLEGEGDDEFNGDEFSGESDSELSKQIDGLIEEAKKRKVSDKNDLHFLKFLNKSQVDNYYNLTNEEQEQVKLYLNEKSYFSNKEVLKLISEAISIEKETLEKRLLRLMPSSIKPKWNELNESAKKSVLSQAVLYPDLDTDTKVENFWFTRPFKKNESTKKLVNHDSLIQEDKLSEKELTSILERFKSLK